MRLTRVLLDVDEVVGDFVGFYLSLANKKTNGNYKREQVTEWSIPAALNLPTWAKYEIEYELSQPGAAHRIALLPGAKEAVKELSQYSEIVFVSAPYKSSKCWAHDRQEWLNCHFGESKLICTSYKTPIQGDFFVDDRPENVKPWIEENVGMAIIWDKPHNKDFSHPLVRRMSEWPKLIEMVKEHPGVKSG